MGKDKHSKGDKKSRFNDESVKLTHRGLSPKKSQQVRDKSDNNEIKNAKGLKVIIALIALGALAASMLSSCNTKDIDVELNDSLEAKFDLEFLYDVDGTKRIYDYKVHNFKGEFGEIYEITRVSDPVIARFSSGAKAIFCIEDIDQDRKGDTVAYLYDRGIQR